jgi:GAF domain-containing protein
VATRDVERHPLAEDRYYSDEFERLRLLLEASSTLLGSLDVETMLPEIVELARRTLAADAYALWRRDAASGEWTIAAHAGLPESYVQDVTAAIRGHDDTVLIDSEPLVVEDVTAAEWLTPAHRRAHAEAGTRSLLVTGLRYGDRIVGTLAFYYRKLRQFTEAEKNAASLLANLAAAAVGTAELYEAQRRLAEDQRFVAEASELLASSLEYERTLTNVARLAVPRFADWCAIDMLESDGSIRRLAVAHVDPEKVRLADELVEKYPPDPDAAYGVPNVIRMGEPELFAEISDELLQEATADTPELLDVLRKLGLRSSMCVPLLDRDRAALRRGRPEGRSGPGPPCRHRRRQRAALPRDAGRTPRGAGLARCRRRRLRRGARGAGVHGYELPLRPRERGAGQDQRRSRRRALRSHAPRHPR